ncbi:MAG: type I-B CRISPR-associated protein Cas8b1/Cst1 [Caldibacillus debilis]|uniref:Type I-B CRISPR-associated protein Cas8b1/Cst1 n=1 Tax=Caldibacillus debilis TaxID=301148 RepID=A0A3E0K3R1_9BACI|nr:type I-B CRISPR-associated protein Cas8b1/Cst1 [Caldibacillus debilis]REJ27600.1 MAG: type I-B CRISPR-associated protein Cas8b1/Cst1 [Caldibacillus debilis]
MEKMTVRMGEWFFTQALAGYKKILESHGVKVETVPDGIIIEKRHLELLPEAFFAYYLKQYSVASREERIIRGLHKKWKEGNSSVKTELNRRINDIKKKTEKYFSKTKEGARLIELAESYRKEKKYSEETDQWIDQFLELLKTEEIDHKLTANFFKTVHLNPYFGQVSFLNVSKNSLSLEEQKETFYKDFVLPVLEEWEFYEALEKGDRDEVLNIVGKSANSLSSLKRPFRKKTLEEMKAYIEREVHKCSFTDFPIALHSFDEGIFVPLALSIGNAINMTWDSNGKELLPLCSLARLLIFCSQAGATMSQGKSVFVYYGGTFDEIYQTNQFYARIKSENRTFDEIVFDLVREQKLRADYTKNHYMIYEYTSDYQSKRTLLNYMVMTPSLVRLFSDHANLFEKIHHTNKSGMVRLLLQGIDPKHFITEVLRGKVKNSYPSFEVVQMTIIRHLNQIYAKGDFEVDSNLEKRYVWALVKSAEQVKHKIGNDKKAQGIAYRLLNAVRSNDKNTFMDTVMRTYISCDLEIPGILLEALHENKLDFATVGNAWIAGLISKANERNGGEDLNE